MKKLLLIAALLIAPVAHAADLATKAAAALTAGYPTKCGFYYGIGTGGNAGAVSGAPAGTQVVQGDIDAIVGYTCPFATNAFWFAEGQGGFSNLNGSTSGLSFSGPGVFIERIGVGSPINNLLNIFPNLNFPALPSLPVLPAGITASPGNGYLFAGLVEQVFGVLSASATGHNWVLAPIVGTGILTRLSNNVDLDVWAGWQMNATNSVCLASGQCVKPSNMVRVGTSLKY
jgi:hypothetical protein